MVKFYQKSNFLQNFIQLIKECDQKILDIYSKDFDIEYKKDESPLTIADKVSNNHICDFLQKINTELEQETNEKFLIISEENKTIDYELRKKYDYCWLVDPIDGTKEFIKKNGEFTVNIGLIYKGVPIFGIVSIPVQGCCYYGIEGMGSFKLDKDNNKQKLCIDPKKMNNEHIKIVASKSHLNSGTKEFIEAYPKYELVSIGSSIKLLYIAESIAHLYPRIAPTYEWDTCAAHAVVKYAGGIVKKFQSEDELIYNKESLLNPYFIVQ